MVSEDQIKSANLGIRTLTAILDSLTVSLIWYFTIEIWGHVERTADPDRLVMLSACNPNSRSRCGVKDDAERGWPILSSRNGLL
jgi:hypothetical protein